MNKKTIFLVIFLLIVILGGFTYLTKKEPEMENMAVTEFEKEETDTMSGYVDVSISEASKLIKDDNEMIIIDVSPNYDKGHILGSVNYYVGDGSLDKAIAMLDKNRNYLVYCHVDSAAILGANKLVEAGFKNVYRLLGNYGGWVDAGMPVISNISDNENVEKVNLEAVNGLKGEGEGWTLRTETGLEHKVEAILADPDEGMFYEGWLVDDENALFISTGKLRKDIDDSWMLEYVNKDNYVGYESVVITVENVDDGQPEKHILESI